MICFCAVGDLETTHHSDSVYMNRTFNTAPMLFKHISTIHKFVGEKQLQCLFQNIMKAHATNVNLKHNPQKTVSDFASDFKAAVAIDFA